MKRQWKIRYKETGENFTRIGAYHGYVLNEALERFTEDLKLRHAFVSEIVSASKFDSNNYYLLQYEDEDDTYIYNFDDESELFNSASKVLAFSDCTDGIKRFEVYLDNQEVEYIGWQPGMRYTWKYKTGRDIVWDQCYPDWDH